MKAVSKESLFLVVKTSEEIQKKSTTRRKIKINCHQWNSNENTNSYPMEKCF